MGPDRANAALIKDKDIFEAALREQEISHDSREAIEIESQTLSTSVIPDLKQINANVNIQPRNPSQYFGSTVSVGNSTSIQKNREEEDDEEDNVDLELGKFQSTGGDPDKMAKMQTILSQFDEHQMSRYESFRRSGFQKGNMKRLLGSITGSNKISVPMTIVVSGIAKMFVGDLVETARTVMAERKESGPKRPCHIREAYRRLRLESKIARKSSVHRLF